MEKEYIVISDFRALPVLAAVHIVRRFSSRRNITLIVSSRCLNSHDYGQFLPAIYKKLKIKVISYFFQVIYVAPNLDTHLTDTNRLGVLSSLKSLTCDSEASNESHPALFSNLSVSALGAREIFDYLINESPQRVFIFNGRTASSYPIVRGCFDHGIDVAYYEYAFNSYSGFRLYPYPPHSTTRLGADISHFRKICIKSIPDLFLMGKRWGEKKLRNEFTKSYQESANIGYDVVVFLGSDHEYTCIDEDYSGFKFIGNIGLVKAVINKYGTSKSVAVRAHPNQINDKSHRLTLDPIIDLCKEHGFVFYGPESKVSSYELIKKSSVVAVEYSSIAYDTVLLGKQVDVFGDLDLKVILSQVAHVQLLDRDYLASHVREVMALYDDLFFVEFNYFEVLVCRVLFVLEWRLMRSSVPPKSLLSAQES